VRGGGTPLMVSEPRPEGAVNAPSKGSRTPDQPGTDAALARLAEALRARIAHTTDSVDAFLANLTTVVPQHVTGTRHAGIVLIGRDKQVRSQSATDFRPLIIDGIQQRCRCGPSLDVDDDHPVCRADDLGGESRWPTFVAPVLACSPIRSILAIQLFKLNGVRGVLNVYANQPGAFPLDTAGIGELFATETSLVVQHLADASDLLERSIAADSVEQAARLLMGRYHVDRLAAYSLLVRLANGSGHTVAAVARRLFRADTSTEV
jgi:hypothetical protein